MVIEAFNTTFFVFHSFSSSFFNFVSLHARLNSKRGMELQEKVKEDEKDVGKLIKQPKEKRRLITLELKPFTS